MTVDKVIAKIIWLTFWPTLYITHNTAKTNYLTQTYKTDVKLSHFSHQTVLASRPRKCQTQSMEIAEAVIFFYNLNAVPSSQTSHHGTQPDDQKILCEQRIQHARMLRNAPSQIPHTVRDTNISSAEKFGPYKVSISRFTSVSGIVFKISCIIKAEN